VRRFIPGLDDLGPKGTFAMKPGRFVTTASDATLAEKIDAINNTDNFLRMMKVDPAVRSRPWASWPPRWGTGFEQFDATKNYLNVLGQAFTDAGMDKDMAKALTKISDHANIAAYGQRWLAVGSTSTTSPRSLGNPTSRRSAPASSPRASAAASSSPTRARSTGSPRGGARIVASGADRANLRLPFAGRRVLAEPGVEAAHRAAPGHCPTHPRRGAGPHGGQRPAVLLPPPARLHHDGHPPQAGPQRPRPRPSIFEAAIFAREGAAYRKALRQRTSSARAEDQADATRHMFKTGDWAEVDRAPAPSSTAVLAVHTGASSRPTPRRRHTPEVSR
jgi:hypothetical protein